MENSRETFSFSSARDTAGVESNEGSSNCHLSRMRVAPKGKKSCREGQVWILLDFQEIEKFLARSSCVKKGKSLFS